jgi:cell division protein ZapA (FtsZ GTPase activity inhibitor)
MLNSFTILIDNVEYKVEGDESKITESATLLNKVLSEFSSKHKELNLTALERTTFVALNIADMKNTSELNHETTIKEIISEIKNITTYINNFLIEK